MFLCQVFEINRIYCYTTYSGWLFEHYMYTGALEVQYFSC